MWNNAEYLCFNSFLFMQPVGNESYLSCGLCPSSLQSSKARDENITAALVLPSYGTNLQSLWQWFIVQERHIFQKQRRRKKDIICLVFAIFTLWFSVKLWLTIIWLWWPINSPNRSSIWVKDSFFFKLKRRWICMFLYFPCNMFCHFTNAERLYNRPGLITSKNSEFHRNG